MSKNRGRDARRRSLRSRKPRPSRTSAGLPRLTTPEGDDVVFASARYRHEALRDIVAILGALDDFGLKDQLEEESGAATQAEGTFEFPWYETRPGAPKPVAIGRRVLAHVTLTPETLAVEAPSHRRLADCRERLEGVLGDRIRLVETRALSPEEALRERPPTEPAEFILPPPEVLEQFEEHALKQWVDDSIPALGGRTPREAAKTPEGREELLALIDYMTEMTEARSHLPGAFSPDYRKVKKMLGLE